ncbi:MAG: hypothetical protein ABIQ65_10995, partial [Thermoanaerobaculia bacterium]
MSSSPRREIAFLRAFEGAIREGVLLDRSLGGVLESTLELMDADAVALLPGAGVPPLFKASQTSSGGIEQTLQRHLEEALAANRIVSGVEAGVSFYSVPIRVGEKPSGSFGMAVKSHGEPAELAEPARLVGLILSHLLERERTVSSLIRRRDEALSAALSAALAAAPRDSAAPPAINGVENVASSPASPAPAAP